MNMNVHAVAAAAVAAAGPGPNSIKRMKCATIVADREQSSHSQIVRSMPQPAAPRPPDAPSGRTILGNTENKNAFFGGPFFAAAIYLFDPALAQL